MLNSSTLVRRVYCSDWEEEYWLVEKSPHFEGLSLKL